jgi:hypothetical protein
MSDNGAITDQCVVVGHARTLMLSMPFWVRSTIGSCDGRSNASSGVRKPFLFPHDGRKPQKPPPKAPPITPT